MIRVHSDVSNTGKPSQQKIHETVQSKMSKCTIWANMIMLLNVFVSNLTSPLSIIRYWKFKVAVAYGMSVSDLVFERKAVSWLWLGLKLPVQRAQLLVLAHYRDV